MMTILKKTFLLIFLFTHVSISYSQERIVTGYVTTLKKIALDKAEVKVLSSKVSVLTDTTGYFEVSCSPKDKIKISANGFTSQKIILNENTKELSINLKFKPSEKNIDLAIGFGHIKESDKTLSVTSIKNDDGSKFRSYTNMLDVIIDSSPSINITNGEIVIRGQGSLLGSNAALILLDGSPINMTQLQAIEVTVVKSVDVLKGSSAAIYGTRGANGVILITTKK
jgi:TonB-dependent SusC/RagA subfamily outer membrane receptor